MTDQNDGLDQIRAVYADKCAEINGNEYHFLAMKHAERRKVFAFYSTIAGELQSGSFGFLDTDRFAAIEKVIFQAITFDGSTLSKLPNHWEEYAEDYLMLIATSLAVISLPFMGGIATGSRSNQGQAAPITLSKPM